MNSTSIFRSEASKNLKNTKFLNLGKSASDLGTDASDRKMDVEFVISDPENP